MAVNPVFVQTKKCSKCGIDSDRSNFTNHPRNRDGLQSHCNKCRAIAKKKYYDANLEKMRAVKREYYANNAEAIKERQRTNRAPRNPAVTLANTRKRQLAKLNRTPKWANLVAIEEIYKDAAEFKAAGLNVHVDHIIPLRARLASGLHVHQNLTIKLAEWNDSKGNKYVVR